MLRRFFKSLKSGTEYLNYGRPLISDWAAQALQNRLWDLFATTKPSRGYRLSVLDLGCGHGTDLLNIRNELSRREALGQTPMPFTLELHGIENHAPYARECRKAGIVVRSLDIEKDRLGRSLFDVIVANQVLEHTKEIFWICAEVVRLLRPGGRFLVGVPNLASLHNRLLLLCGQQPTAQLSLSAHVRSFTRRDLQAFGEAGGFLKMKRYAGSNFYPFPPAVARPLARFFPSLAWGLFMEFERTHVNGDFLSILKTIELETPYYGGPAHPVKN
ncbi:MAG: class I SAM-dependent methyltransferase [Spirochaetales bacterium]|nr:class I SAM-dependent methyltransferase [Spirochaetales bacterium]